MGQHPVLVSGPVAGGKNHPRRVHQHLFERQHIGLVQSLRRGGIGIAGAAEQVGDQGVRAGHDPPTLPDQRRDWLARRSAIACQCGLDPRHQRLAAFGMADQRGDGANLRLAFGNGLRNPESFEPQPQPVHRRNGGRAGERAADHQIGLQLQQFLDRTRSGAKPPRGGHVHRTGGGILAVAGNRQQLRGIGHFGQHRVAAGVEADYLGLRRPRLARRNRRAGGQGQRKKRGQPPYHFTRTPA